MTQPTYPAFRGDVVDPTKSESLAFAIRRLGQVLGLVQSGKLNNVGTVTLRDGQATTTVMDSRASAFSLIAFEPLTANAAAELYGATMHVTAANHMNGAFVITHANAVSTDRTFKYAIVG